MIGRDLLWVAEATEGVLVGTPLPIVAVLLKGSRKVGLERVATALFTNFSDDKTDAE